MSGLLWFVAGLVAGGAAGAMWREAFELLTRKDDPVALWHRFRTNRQTLLLVGLTLSMIFTGLVGIGLAVSNSDRSDLVRCITRYNTAVAEARDSREVAGKALTAAELEYVDADLTYQLGILRALRSDAPSDQLQGVVSARVEATEEYKDVLRGLREVRDDQPFPAPDTCEALR